MAETRRLSELVAQTTTLAPFPDGNLVVALSGGADSGSLGLLARGRSVRAVHVDHGLTHSPMMRAAAAAIAERLGMDLTVVETVVPAGASLEAKARDARYAALAESTTAEEAVLTAHTADDNTETVLINLVRGSGATGLAGIPPFRPPNIHRPLLSVRRSTLREMAMLGGLPFADDPMNLDPALTRNRVRVSIVPLLAELNPEIDRAVLRSSRALRADNELLDELADSLHPDLGPGRATIPVGVLVTAPRAVADRVVIAMLGHVLGRGAVTALRVEDVWAVVEGVAERRELGDAAVVWRTGAVLCIGVGAGERPGVVVDLTPGVHHVGGLVLEVTRHHEMCRVAPITNWQAIFPLDARLTWDGVVLADGVAAWSPGVRRHPVAWYQPGEVGYLSVLATEEAGWKSDH
ncbi:MAG: tRNA lysidine(34) synthetase TilS [Actinobacteria bacterium]|nr:tRNA lysidine(34) synthetase TilS [Actinomycetota bacterium]